MLKTNILSNFNHYDLLLNPFKTSELSLDHHNFYLSSIFLLEWQPIKNSDLQKRLNFNQPTKIISSSKIKNTLDIMNPNLAKQWHMTKNGALKPSDVTCGSNRKVWWQCDKGHEWQALIFMRNKGSNCPYCSNKKTLKGYNDLETLNPALAKQWHPTKNGDLKPSHVTYGSNQKVWWQCEKGHEWQTTVYNRSDGCNCPICNNKQLLKGYNDLQTINPKLSKQWHSTKNGHLTPSDVFPNANKKVWWQCDKGHEWEANVYSRQLGKDCPYCTNKKVLKGYNDLSTTNPTLAKQWHTTKNGDLKPTDITSGSRLKVWWQCEKGHEWQSAIYNRSNGCSCPVCNNKQLLKGYNDLETINPNLAKEWHPTKNGDLTPSEVFPYSNKKVWWVCDKGHEWKTGIDIRHNGSHCPICSNEMKTSFPEQVIYYYLSQIFKSTSNRKLINKKEADIFIEELNLIIEYDGAYFHKNKNQLDRNKNKAFQDYHFIRIRENGLMPIEDYGCKNYILKNTSNSQLEEMVYFILDYIKQNFVLTKQTLNQIKEMEVNLNEDQVTIYNTFVLKEKESSLSATNPTLAKEWHLTKNGLLTPEHVFPNSNKKVWWQCDKGHEWQAIIRDRNYGNGCPYCKNKKILKGYNDLATVNPILAKEWHTTKNGHLKPSEVFPNSNQKIWWQCEKGHEWQSSIQIRNKGSNCPYCGNKKILKGYNDLQTHNPTLAKEWHPTKNGHLTPSDVFYKSKKKVWWLLNNGYEWEESILSRNKVRHK